MNRQSASTALCIPGPLLSKRPEPAFILDVLPRVSLLRQALSLPTIIGFATQQLPTAKPDPCLGNGPGQLLSSC